MELHSFFQNGYTRKINVFNTQKTFKLINTKTQFFCQRIPTFMLKNNFTVTGKKFLYHTKFMTSLNEGYLRKEIRLAANM